MYQWYLNSMKSIRWLGHRSPLDAPSLRCLLPAEWVSSYQALATETPQVIFNYVGATLHAPRNQNGAHQVHSLAAFNGVPKVLQLVLHAIA
jgi:hypothetical protein